jgi:hypothetical protein
MPMEGLALLAFALLVWELNEIRKYLRRVWTNHYLLNREALDDLLIVGAPEPGREDGASGAVRPKKAGPQT